LAGFKPTTLLKLGVGSRAAANAVAARKAPIAIRRWTRESPSKWSRNGKIPPEAGLRQRREQRLRLGDHRHLRRRRKACERGREDSVGFDETAGRLVELGER
jgi:hypothetical protein